MHIHEQRLQPVYNRRLEGFRPPLGRGGSRGLAFLPSFRHVQFFQRAGCDMVAGVFATFELYNTVAFHHEINEKEARL